MGDSDFQFSLRRDTQDEQCYRDVVLGNEYQLPDQLPPDSVLIDVGANIGCFAHAALLRGAKRVYCYEPDPENFKLLSANLAHYGDRVVLRHAAVWRSDTQASDFIGLNKFANPIATAMGHTLPYGQASFTVPCVSMDSIIQEVAGDGDFYCLKLDCEGAEYPIVFTSTRLKQALNIVGESHWNDELPKIFDQKWQETVSHEGLVEVLRRHFGFEVMVSRQPQGGHINQLFFARRPAPRKPCKILFFRFPYGNHEEPDVTDWMIETVIEASRDDRIEEMKFARIADTPITMTRNRAVKVAKEIGADLLVMVDSDMAPDLYKKDEQATPFWKTAFDFWWNYPGPCIIAAPYCGPPPNESCYVFEWQTRQNDVIDGEGKIAMIPREAAAAKRGIGRVAALPTGLMLIDMKAFEGLKEPYFYYEMDDYTCSGKASTEDVTFTRDADFAGVPLYCTWDSWAGHWKRKCVGRPMPLPMGIIPHKFRQSVERELALTGNTVSSSALQPLEKVRMI